MKKDSIEYCPHCGISLQGEPIKKESQHLYGGATHFSRKIGVSDMMLDRIVKWVCPDCNGEWPVER